MVNMGGSNYLVKIFKVTLAIIIYIFLYAFYNLLLVRILCAISLLFLIWISDNTYIKLFYRIFKK